MLSYEDTRFLPQAPGILGEMERNGLDVPGLEHLGRKVNKEHEMYGQSSTVSRRSNIILIEIHKDIVTQIV